MGIKIHELNNGIEIKDDDVTLISQYNTTSNGLSGVYYNSTNFTNPVLTRLDSVINFNWGAGSPDPLVNSNNFSVRWEGKIVPKYTESYIFYTGSDDKSSLWINDTLIVTNPIGEISGTIDLQANVPVNIKLELTEYQGFAAIQLKWSSPSQAKEIVPNSQLLAYNNTENSSSSRKTLKVTASQIRDSFISEFTSKLTELDNNHKSKIIDTSTFNNFLPVSGGKKMTGDIRMEMGSSIAEYSAKILSFDNDFTLLPEHNTAVILVDKINTTSNLNNKVKITVNPNTLSVGFNVVIIQTNNTLVEVFGSNGIELWNADGLRTTRGKYSLINLCVLKQNKVWLSGDVGGVSDLYNLSWSALFEPSKENKLSIPESAANFNFNRGDFTVEAWYYCLGNGDQRIFGSASGGFMFGSYTGIAMGVEESPGWLYISNTKFPLNQWCHVAYVMNASKASIYLNGNRILGPTSNTNNFNAVGSPLIGATTFKSGYYANGYISNLRVVKGLAVYTTSSITVPTSPLTTISGTGYSTSLLTLQDNIFKDNSPNNFTITPVGTAPTIHTISPF